MPRRGRHSVGKASGGNGVPLSRGGELSFQLPAPVDLQPHISCRGDVNAAATSPKFSVLCKTPYVFTYSFYLALPLFTVRHPE